MQIPGSNGLRNTSLWRKPRFLTWDCCDFSLPGLACLSLLSSSCSQKEVFAPPQFCPLRACRILELLPMANSMPNYSSVVQLTSSWTRLCDDFHICSIFFLVWAHRQLRVKLSCPVKRLMKSFPQYLEISRYEATLSERTLNATLLAMLNFSLCSMIINIITQN